MSNSSSCPWNGRSVSVCSWNSRFVRCQDHKVPTVSSSSRHTAASRKLAADYDSVASQTSSRKLDVDHETIVPNVFEFVSWRQRDRELNVV